MCPGGSYRGSFEEAGLRGYPHKSDASSKRMMLGSGPAGLFFTALLLLAGWPLFSAAAPRACDQAVSPQCIHKGTTSSPISHRIFDTRARGFFSPGKTGRSRARVVIQKDWMRKEERRGPAFIFSRPL
jgi:hypothetical protein